MQESGDGGKVNHFHNCAEFDLSTKAGSMSCVVWS